MSDPRPLNTQDGQFALQLLQDAGAAGLTLADLRSQGIGMPAQALYEVELSGWPIDRRSGRIRLRPPEAQERPPFQMPPKVRRLPRDSS